MRVNVTNAHIKAGERGSAGRCAVAAAVGAATGVALMGAGALSAANPPAGRGVTLLEGRVSADGRDLGEMPTAAQDWVRAFDSGEDVKPISFDLKR